MFGALVRFALLNNIIDDTVVSFDGTSTTTPPTRLLLGRVAEQSILSYRRQGAHEGTLTGARVIQRAHLLVWEFLFISRSWCSCIQRLEPGRGRLEHLVRGRALALEPLRVLTGPHVSVEQTL